MDSTGKTQREQNLAALIDLCGLISLDIDLDALLYTVITMAPKLVKAEEASIILVPEERDEIIFHMATSREEALKKVRLAYGEGIAGSVIATGQPAVVNNVGKDTRHCKTVDLAIEFQTRNMICVPMSAGDRVVGALTVVNKLDGADFDEHDLSLVEATASQASIAIERSRLIEQNLESARLAAIGQTVAGLAHCIRNIVTGLKGGQFVVNTGLEQQDMETVTQGWGVMERNTSRISSLVMDMLSYSTDREPVLASVDLDALVSDVVELQATQAEALSVELRHTARQKVPDLLADQNEIYRCLVNLVRNAMEACSKGGVVELETGLTEDGAVSIKVSDNGSGMDQSTLDSLFVKIFSTKGSRGAGFGLPTTYKIITEHHGSISVESEVGQGSTFSVRLPREA